VRPAAEAAGEVLTLIGMGDCRMAGITKLSPRTICAECDARRWSFATTRVSGHVDEYFSDCAVLDGLVCICCVGEREPVQR
jgi:hypothetical protein